jgi:hypothetical protein
MSKGWKIMTTMTVGNEEKEDDGKSRSLLEVDHLAMPAVSS